MRRTPTLAATALALALVATACTSSGGDGDSDAAGGSLRVWTHINKSFNKAYQELADEYMNQNPDVSIEIETFPYDTYVQTLQTSLPAGTEADVLQMFGSWTCSYSDNLATVPADVATTTDAQEIFFPGPLGGYECDDQLYGMPQESNVEYGATLVNTAMAEDAGVSLDGWDSFDEFMADAKKLAVVEDGKITRSGYHFTTNDGISYTLLSLILQNGGSFLAEDGTFTFQTPEAEASLDLMKSMVDEGITDPVLYGDVNNWVGDCFFTEQCAMGLVGPWVVPESSADFPDMVPVTEYVPLPTLDNADFVADSGWGLTVSSNSTEQELAWDFAAFVAQDADNALSWNLQTGTLPALKANAKGEARATILEQSPYAEAWLDSLENARYIGALEDRDRLFYRVIVPNVLDVLGGEASTQDALAAIEEEANSI